MRLLMQRCLGESFLEYYGSFYFRGCDLSDSLVKNGGRSKLFKRLLKKKKKERVWKELGKHGICSHIWFDI